jgi:hypothetical protein
MEGLPGDGAFPFTLLLAIGGMAIWCGWYRGWADRAPGGFSDRALAIPWIALAFILLSADMLLVAIGVEVPRELVIGLFVGLALFGFAVAGLRWPPWALPPWYRRFDKLRREAEERDRRAA